ncbi:hypothetical protein SKAU_G00352230 [Synaphobranchus kaupii]|uniref:Uncharacterized protein n=1 Tax=Synaphobranchus kaupii TaxID=118154 RepID=A0A9Q1IHC4_SYNKA|nr:hypothetical protein SKAU_G00352230 [Synaphobranchus kaupii]
MTDRTGAAPAPPVESAPRASQSCGPSLVSRSGSEEINAPDEFSVMPPEATDTPSISDLCSTDTAPPSHEAAEQSGDPRKALLRRAVEALGVPPPAEPEITPSCFDQYYLKGPSSSVTL